MVQTLSTEDHGEHGEHEEMKNEVTQNEIFAMIQQFGKNKGERVCWKLVGTIFEEMITCTRDAMVRFDAVGEISGHVILQLHQAHDLAAAACSNSHHFENSDLTRPGPKSIWIGTCLNFIHFHTQAEMKTLLRSQRFEVIPVVNPHVFEILTTMTFGALHKNTLRCKHSRT